MQQRNYIKVGRICEGFGSDSGSKTHTNLSMPDYTTIEDNNYNYNKQYGYHQNE